MTATVAIFAVIAALLLLSALLLIVLCVRQALLRRRSRRRAQRRFVEQCNAMPDAHQFKEALHKAMHRGLP